MLPKLELQNDIFLRVPKFGVVFFTCTHVKPSFTPPHTIKMAALMSTSSAFAGMKVQARVTVRSQRAQTVIMANGSGPKRVSTRNQPRYRRFYPPLRASMDASRASDPRVDARIVSFGSRAFCLDRVLDPKRPARALASRFPRLRGFPYLAEKKTTWPR